MSNRRVLFVDDEVVLLETYRRLLGRSFEIQTAVGPERGLETIQENGPFAVIVSDLRMPRMDGIEFLSRARAIAPDSIRVMLTGYAETNAAVAAVNEGHIFRFLTKPCPHDQLVATLETCIEQHRLIMAERELLEKTLSGSVRILTDLLGLTNPGAVGRASRIRRIVGHLSRALNLPNAWQFELAGMLSQIGCLTIAPDILDKVWAGQPLTPDEEAVYASHPSIGAQLLSHIPRLTTVARMIALQATPVVSVDEEPSVREGAQMIRVAVVLDQWIARGLSVAAAAREMRRDAHEYPESLLTALESLTFDERPKVSRIVKVSELSDSMVLAEDVRTRNGILLVAKGHEVSVPVILRLKSFARGVGVKEPFRVWVTDETDSLRRAA